MHNIDREIADYLYVAIKASEPETIQVERHEIELAWVIVKLKTGEEVGWCWQTPELCWEHVGFSWSEDIAAALALVEELKMPFALNYNPTFQSWIGCDMDRAELAQEDAISAIAVARVILAWLRAREEAGT